MKRRCRGRWNPTPVRWGGLEVGSIVDLGPSGSMAAAHLVKPLGSVPLQPLAMSSFDEVSCPPDEVHVLLTRAHVRLCFLRLASASQKAGPICTCYQTLSAPVAGFGFMVAGPAFCQHWIPPLGFRFKSISRTSTWCLPSFKAYL